MEVSISFPLNQYFTLQAKVEADQSLSSLSAVHPLALRQCADRTRRIQGKIFAKESPSKLPSILGRASKARELQRAKNINLIKVEGRDCSRLVDKGAGDCLMSSKERS